MPRQPKMIPAVKQASAQGLKGEAALQAINDAIGEKKAEDFKLSQAKITAIVASNASQPLSEPALKERLQDAVTKNDYDGVILSLVKKYCPTGLLGLALTALLASFMSGMAGNVTAFNTVWTYDLYQAYFARNKSDDHYFWMGKVVTVVGIVLSIALRLLRQSVQQRHGRHPARVRLRERPAVRDVPAGHVLGADHGHRAPSWACCGGTATSAVFHALTIAAGNAPGAKGGYIAVAHTFPSEMAQNFWLATFAFIVCFVLTAGISLATRADQDRRGAQGLGLLAHAQDQGRRGDVALASRRAGRHSAGRLRWSLNFIFW